jgi:putative Ca2+/H+ antiporter (TMEM165/GDT1 family)
MWRIVLVILLTRWVYGTSEKALSSPLEHGLHKGGDPFLPSSPPPSSSALKSLVPATVNGFTMTVATEIGDKTFCIAAVMAMRYNRLLVFSGAAGALLVMTVLSVAIGVALPALLPKEYTHYAAAALFVYFGVKLLQEARAMPADGGGEHSELAEAEEELEKKLRPGDGGEGTPRARDNGAAGAATPIANSTPSGSDLESESDPSAKQDATKRAAASGHYLQADWAVLTQAFTITFLAEWGDRSQIATIAMAAAQHPVGGAWRRDAAAVNTSPRPPAAAPTLPPPPPPLPHTHSHHNPPTHITVAVCIGSIVGHAMCTGLAVLGGRLLAARISERVVAFAGGVLFLIFALHSLVAGPDVDE